MVMVMVMVTLTVMVMVTVMVTVMVMVMVMLNINWSMLMLTINHQRAHFCDFRELVTIGQESNPKHPGTNCRTTAIYAV